MPGTGVMSYNTSIVLIPGLSVLVSSNVGNQGYHKIHYLCVMQGVAIGTIEPLLLIVFTPPC